MKFKIYAFIILASLCFLGCGSTETAKKPAAQNGASTQATPAKPAGAKNQVALESIPRSTIMKLWNSCTYIDYIFHDLPFSMSQDESESIQANLNYISSEAQPFIPSNCKSIARQMFHVGGDIVLEADVYLSDVCQFYVFVENEKPVYANKMSPSALQFFSTMFNQVDQQKQK